MIGGSPCRDATLVQGGCDAVEDVITRREIEEECLVSAPSVGVVNSSHINRFTDGKKEAERNACFVQ